MFVRGPNPIWFMVDTAGIELNDGDYAFFLTNTLPYVPQPVYQDVNGLNPWPDPLEFQPSGTLPNNLYFDPSLVYRIEIRQGPNQTDPLIWLIENYVPGDNATTETYDIYSAENMITNPQFADIYFSSPFTYTQGSGGTYTIPVGPGWNLVLTGTGTTVLTQNALQGSDDNPGNPPYSLTINNTGWTTAQLVQTFTNNGALFTGGAVALSFDAYATSSSQTITATYVPSGPSQSNTVFSGTVITGPLALYNNTPPIVSILDSINTDSNGAASIALNFNLQPTGIITLTNVQFVGQTMAIPTNVITELPAPAFMEQSYERIVDHEFHVYRDPTVHQAKQSILTAWNFSNNPWQYTLTTLGNVAANQYTADQTILAQQAYVTSATGNNVAVTQGSSAVNYAYTVTAVTAANKFAIIQYIDPFSMADLWGKNVSLRVRAAGSSPTHSTAITFKAKLICNASGNSSLPSAVGQNEPILSWTNVNGSDPVFTTNWQVISAINDPQYTLNNTNILDFDFDQFKLPESTTANMTLGVVIYTTDNMNHNATADKVLFYDISLVQNDFAITTQPETYDQTLSKCQYYYETSYVSAADIGTATSSNSKLAQAPLYVGAMNDSLVARSFNLHFSTSKRADPTMTFYSPVTGTAGKIYMAFNVIGTGFTGSSADQAISQWTRNGGYDNIYMQATSSSAAITSGTSSLNEGLMLYHYTADARLGT